MNTDLRKPIRPQYRLSEGGRLGGGNVGGCVAFTAQNNGRENMDVLGVDDHDEELEDEEEAAPVIVKSTPITPTIVQMELHRVTHLPYREWCDCCVEDSGRENAHRKAKQDSAIAVVSMD